MEKFKSIADILYVKRVSQRMTQTELSKKAGCSLSMVSTIEAGKRIPSIEMIVKIAKALKIDQEELYIYASEDLKKSIARLWGV